MSERTRANLEDNPVRKKPTVNPPGAAFADSNIQPLTVGGLSSRQQGVLRMQQTQGNAAVRRSVQIDELSSNFDVRDESKLKRGVTDEVRQALAAERGRGAGSDTSDDTSSSEDNASDSSAEGNYSVEDEKYIDDDYE